MIKKYLFVLLITSSVFSADISNRQTPFLGVAYQVIDTENYNNTVGFGYEILRVLKDTSADVIGLKVGDIIIAFDNQDLSKINEEDRQNFLSKAIKAKQVGDIFNLVVLRENNIITEGSKTLKNITQVKNNIDNQVFNSVLNISIDKRINKLELSAKLGIRQTLKPEDLPDNNTLFPKYTNISWDWTESILQILNKPSLTLDYKDLLARYEDNELWDEGFRLNLFRYLHRDPIKFVPVLDKRLNELNTKLSKNHKHFIMPMATWLDQQLEPIKTNYPTSSNLAVHKEFINTTINLAETLRQQAFASLTMSEIKQIKTQMPQLMQRFYNSFYIDRPKVEEDRKNNSALLALTKKIDINALFKSGQLLLQLMDKTWLNQLTKLLKQHSANISFTTTAGTVLLGAVGNSQHNKSYALLIDISGDDIYYQNTGISNDNIAITIDLAGNDSYQHTRKFAQGSAFLGIGLLIDISGNDSYLSEQQSQGFALLGVGALLDLDGDDKYHSEYFSQGSAFWGIAALIDIFGNDNYYANLYAQGLGSVKGFGLLFDNSGDDNYFASGKDESSYQISGIFKSISQGVGIGFRGYASGGVGILLDSAGKDHFRSGNFGGGVGYFYGIGALKNAGIDNDTYLGSRYSFGASAHSAMGILIDDGGDDNYFSISGVSQSAAWDLALAALWDKGGNDNYTGSNSFASHNGFSIFIDESGNDIYNNLISSGHINDYHGGASFGFFIDKSGSDTYQSPQKNSTQTITLKNGIFIDY